MTTTTMPTQAPAPEPELLTPAEYAAKFRVTTRSVYRWIDAGQLIAVRVGHVLRLPADQLPRKAA